MGKIDQRQSNLIKAGIVGLVFLALSVIAVQPVLEIEKIGMEKMMESCKVDCQYTYTPYSPVLIVVTIVPPLVLFVLSFKYLEAKRIKNWRSWR